MIIENGGGSPQAWAKVDINNRLHTLSVSEGFNIDAALKGVNFNINSGSRITKLENLSLKILL
jgi:hypothetical protein